MEEILHGRGVELCGTVPFSACRVINPGLLARLFGAAVPLSVTVFCVPYYSGEREGRNISLYSVPCDYHIYFKSFFESIADEIKEKYPECVFRGASDHSPIDEVGAAAFCGLGAVGDNGRLITEKYGSFVFIGEIISTLPTDKSPQPIKHCTHCGNCKAACPSPESCLSAITQRKGELDADEAELMKRANTVWGCDLCQLACPLNKSISQTNIDYFRQNLIYRLDKKTLSEMTDSEFKERAFSWRGRAVVLRNIEKVN